MASRLKSLDARAIYFYGISAKSDARPSGVGIDGRSAIEAIDCAGLQCWISHVSSVEFSDNLAKNIENLDWLSEAGVRHQQAVSAIAEEADILPARFGTVFLDTSSLCADISGRKKVLTSDLKKIQGCEEWGVKIFSVQPVVKLPTKKPATGRDYLKSKAALLRRPPEVLELEDMESFSSALKSISVETAAGGKISGGQRGLRWQSSLLLKRPDRKKLQALLKKYSGKWADSARIECTGPWPPYSFVAQR